MAASTSISASSILRKVWNYTEPSRLKRAVKQFDNYETKETLDKHDIDGSMPCYREPNESKNRQDKRIPIPEIQGPSVHTLRTGADLGKKKDVRVTHHRRIRR